MPRRGNPRARAPPRGVATAEPAAVGDRRSRRGAPALRVIGIVRSPLRSVRAAPCFYTEGAPDAFIEVRPAYRKALGRIETGDELVVITWLHRARRDVLRTHPEDDRRRPLTGVFRTRSQDRPNPLGLHRCTVREVTRTGLRLGPIEAIDGTPVVDLKPVVREAADY